MIHVRTYCPPAFIERLELDKGIGVFPHYRSIVRDKQSLVKIATARGGNVVLAYTDKGQIVGYIELTYPDPLERWSECGDGFLYELGSIEVSQYWRRLGIAEAMVKLTFADDWLEDKIVVLTGYTWHWDLEGCGLTKIKYRQMMMGIFAPAGFVQFYTDEPNITMDLANLLLGRIGSRVSSDEITLFYDLLFAKSENYDF